MIPAISVALPVILNLIQWAETAFGPKTGDAKKATVLDMLKAAFARLGTAGIIPAVPSEAEISGAIEAALANLKSTGTLKPNTDLAKKLIALAGELL